jgi:NitT/TauT family transport system substrate-binding protein
MRVHNPIRRTRTALALALTALVAVAATACGSDSGTAKGSDDKLVLADGAQTLSAFNAPYSAWAVDHIWKKDGLNVQVEFTQGGTQSAQLVASGKADVSVVGLSSALSVAAQSPDLKIIAITGGNIWHLAVPTDSSIQSIDDLKGKTIGVQALNTGMYLYNRAALKLAGLDPDKDVTWLPIGTGAQAADAINSGKVDAFATYDGPFEVVSGLTKGGLRLLPSPLDELDGSGAWIANAKVLQERRADIVKFMQGMSKTAILAQTDPQAIIDYLWKVSPETKPRDVSDDEAMTDTLSLVKAYWSKLANMGPEGSYGVLSDDAVAKAVAFHEDSGIVEGKIDIAKTFDLSVAEDADKYDHAAVTAEAAKGDVS